MPTRSAQNSKKRPASAARAGEVWQDADDAAARLVVEGVWIRLRGATCNGKKIKGGGYAGDGNVKVVKLQPEVLPYPPSYAGPKAVRTVCKVLTFFDPHGARADSRAGMVHWAGLQFRFLSRVEADAEEALVSGNGSTVALP